MKEEETEQCAICRDGTVATAFPVPSGMLGEAAFKCPNGHEYSVQGSNGETPAMGPEAMATLQKVLAEAYELGLAHGEARERARWETAISAELEMWGTDSTSVHEAIDNVCVAMGVLR